MSDAIVSLKKVCVRLNGMPVLEDITCSVAPNDFLAVIGPNGGGKTTLLKVILGLIEPDSGEVRVFGKSPRLGRKDIGYLSQHTVYDPNFPISVFEAILMGRYRGILRRYSREDREAADEALENVGLFDVRNRQIGRLSGGQRQRVFLARAMARNPRLLLLDEPTASVDPETQQSFYELLATIRERTAIVLVTHDIGVISSRVESVACLNRRLFYHGAMEGSLEKLEDIYECPVEVIAHGIPHRVLKRHAEE